MPGGITKQGHGSHLGAELNLFVQGVYYLLEEQGGLTTWRPRVAGSVLYLSLDLANGAHNIGYLHRVFATIADNIFGNCYQGGLSAQVLRVRITGVQVRNQLIAFNDTSIGSIGPTQLPNYKDC